MIPQTHKIITEITIGYLTMPFPVQDASDYEQNTPEYTYQRNETVFSLRIGQTFLIKGFRRTFKAKSYIPTA